MKRPSFNQTFMNIAIEVSKRSTCDRAHVGCVLVRHERILSTGYNGSFEGMPHCDEIGHLMVDGHCVRTIHAEINAIANASALGINLFHATAFITHFPCYNCMKIMAAFGVSDIIYKEGYRKDQKVINLCEAHNIGLCSFDGKKDHEPNLPF